MKKTKVIGLIIIITVIIFIIIIFLRPSLYFTDTTPVITSKVNLPVNEFFPQNPDLQSIFSGDHSWIATISAEKIRTVIATGDVIPARSVNNAAEQKKNFKWPFEKTAEFLSKGDITYINLESPLTADCRTTTEGMVFCGNSKNIEGLLSAGVDIANVANNHSGNYGLAGIAETKKLLTENKIKITGSENTEYFNIRGVRFAFLGFNDVGSKEESISWTDEEDIVETIKKARLQTDVVIVGFHWGAEYVSQPGTRQIELAHLAIDSGADLILGNHPHWIQPVEFYKSKLIVYAHGNFIFDQMWSEKTREGVVGIYTFYEDRLIDVKFYPVYISNYGQPDFADDLRKDKILKEMKLQSEILQNSLGSNSIYD